MGVLARRTAFIGPAPVQKYLSLPGSSGAYATVPDGDALDLTTSHKMRMRMRMADYTPAAVKVLVAKWPDAAGQRSWAWSLLDSPSGSPYFQWTANGTTVAGTPEPASAPSPALTNNERLWFQFEIVASTRQVIMSTYPDQVAEPTSGWTAVVTSATGSTTGAFYSGTAQMSIGSTSEGTYGSLQADIFQICIRNSSDSLVFTLDPNNWTSGSTWVTDTGQTVTLNGSAAVSS